MIYTTFTQADVSVSGHKVQEKQAMFSYQLIQTLNHHKELNMALIMRWMKRSMMQNKQLLEAKTLVGINICKRVTKYQETGHQK